MTKPSVEGSFESVVLGWWAQLDERRGDRADLRRVGTATQAIFAPAFHRLHRALRQVEERVGIAWLGALAATLAHVREHDGGQTVAGQMGSGDEKAGVSGLRFRRLLQVRDPDELATAMRRVVRLLGGRINVVDLARSMRWWNDRTKQRWAFDYYDKAPHQD